MSGKRLGEHETSRAERDDLIRWYRGHGLGMGWLVAWFCLSERQIRRILTGNKAKG